ncbi:MAG: hypothetical protein ABFS35_23775 [Bacteroidota bacterium]
MSEKNESHWRKVMNTEFLNGDEIQEGTVTIKSYEAVNFYSPKSRKKEDHVTLWFEEVEKPMILTNRKAKQISTVLGTPLMDEWTGKQITIFPKEEKHFGEWFQVINIKAATVKKAKPELTPDHKKWNDVVKKVASGTSIETVQKHYSISEKNIKLLNK